MQGQKVTNKEVDELVGRNLKRLRSEQGLSQQYIGELIDLSNQQVSKFERGVNGFNVSQLFTIAQECNVEMNYFFET